MDIEQASKTIQWLDDERRKDRQEITSLQERLAAVTAENTNLARRLQQLETDQAALNTTLQKATKNDGRLEGYRKEMTRQGGEVGGRPAGAAKAGEGVQKTERSA